MTRAFAECSFYRGPLWGRMHLCAPKQRDVTYPRSLGAGIPDGTIRGPLFDAQGKYPPSGARHRHRLHLSPSRTGARFSTNAPLAAEFNGGLHVQTPKPRRLPAAWSNGLTAIRRVHRPDAASSVAIVSTAAIRCCRTESSQPAMLGCIRAAGRLGTRHGKGRPPRHSRQWGLTAVTE
jgi:hypothetical protein